MTTRELIQQRLAAYIKAEHDITIHGQTVEIEGMRITRADIESVRKQIAELRRELDALEASSSRPKRSRIRLVIPK